MINNMLDTFFGLLSLLLGFFAFVAMVLIVLGFHL